MIVTAVPEAKESVSTEFDFFPTAVPFGVLAPETLEAEEGPAGCTQPSLWWRRHLAVAPDPGPPVTGRHVAPILVI